MALLRQSDAVIALTDIEADFLASQGIERQRLHVIGGGVDAETLQRGEAARFRARYALAAPVVLYIGALNYQKGATHLVQAMQRLWQQGNAAESGDDRPADGAFSAFLRAPADAAPSALSSAGRGLGGGQGRRIWRPASCWQCPRAPSLLAWSIWRRGPAASR